VVTRSLPGTWSTVDSEDEILPMRRLLESLTVRKTVREKLAMRLSLYLGGRARGRYRSQ